MADLAAADVERLRGAVRPGFFVEELSSAELTALLDAWDEREKLRVQLAGARSVLVDCHAHDLYVNDGADSSAIFRKHHKGFGRIADESAADHERSVKKAVDGSIGDTILTEIAALRAKLASAEQALEAKEDARYEAAVHARDVTISQLRAKLAEVERERDEVRARKWSDPVGAEQIRVPGEVLDNLRRQLDAAIARATLAEKVVEAARGLRGHQDTCGHVLDAAYPCNCGIAAVVDALAAYDAGKETKP